MISYLLTAYANHFACETEFGFGKICTVTPLSIFQILKNQ